MLRYCTILGSLTTNRGVHFLQQVVHERTHCPRPRLARHVSACSHSAYVYQHCTAYLLQYQIFLLAVQHCRTLLVLVLSCCRGWLRCHTVGMWSVEADFEGHAQWSLVPWRSQTFWWTANCIWLYSLFPVTITVNADLNVYSAFASLDFAVLGLHDGCQSCWQHHRVNACASLPPQSIFFRGSYKLCGHTVPIFVMSATSEFLS